MNLSTSLRSPLSWLLAGQLGGAGTVSMPTFGTTTPPPTIDLESGSYSMEEAKTFIVTSPAEAGTTYLTLDESTPTAGNYYATVNGGDSSEAYALDFPVSGFVVKAVFIPTGGAASDVVTRTYSISATNFVFTTGSSAPATYEYTFADFAGTPVAFQVQEMFFDTSGNTGNAYDGSNSGQAFGAPGVDQYYRGRLVFTDWRTNETIPTEYSTTQQQAITALIAPVIADGNTDYPTSSVGDAGNAWTWNNPGYYLALQNTIWPWFNQGYALDVGYFEDGSGDWVVLAMGLDQGAFAGYTTAYKTTLNLQARVNASGNYLGNPSPALTTIVPYEPPTITGASAVDDGAGTINVSVTWDSPASGDSGSQYDVHIINVTDSVNADITSNRTSPYDTTLSATDNAPAEFLQVLVRNAAYNGIPMSTWADSGSFPIDGA